ncbi:MAG: MaoC family dehydratase N-terminal domain-containing protein [Sphingomonadaceae bacterium]
MPNLEAEWANWIGRSQSQEDVLTPAMLTRFRATIDSAQSGDQAPQAIHWALCLPEAMTAALDTDGHPKRGDFLPPLPQPRRMWASSMLDFHRPIVVGDRIERISTIAAIDQKTGGSGALTFVKIDHLTRANEQVAVRERQTLVYREAAMTPPPPLGEGAPNLSEWQWCRTILPSEAMLFRFSALTFNSHRIHYDAPYAITEELYRGLVVHGPLTATLLLDLVAREIGPNQLKSFAFRGVSPAIAREELHLVGRRNGDEVILAALGSDGRDVMTARGAL